MTHWIISANPSFFNHEDAFRNRGFIDWKQTRHFAEGDIVYVYVTRPFSKIIYKTLVIRADMHEEEICNQDEYWIKKSLGNSSNNKYVRLKLIKHYLDDSLSFDLLRAHGLKYAPQSPCRVKKELQEYIDSTEDY